MKILNILIDGPDVDGHIVHFDNLLKRADRFLKQEKHSLECYDEECRALEKYKRNRNGNGYVVRFSAENITDIARNENIKQPVIIEKSSKHLTPETKSLDVIQDKTLPVNTISTTNVLMETQAEILVKNQIEILLA